MLISGSRRITHFGEEAANVDACFFDNVCIGTDASDFEANMSYGRIRIDWNTRLI